MAYLNKVMLIGNVGKHPEIRMTQNGKKNASFSLATTRKYNGENGEKKELTEWHNIVAWGKNADIISLYVKKGQQLFIDGCISYRMWEPKNSSQKRYATDIVVNTFQILSSPSSSIKNDNEKTNLYDNDMYQSNNEEEDDGLPF